MSLGFSHRVIITDLDSTACIQDTFFIITAPQDPLSSTVNLILDVSCFGDSTGAAFAGYVADGHLQSHYRYYIQGALKWQTRVGAGNGTDTFAIYSWTKAADVLNILNLSLIHI